MLLVRFVEMKYILFQTIFIHFNLEPILNLIDSNYSNKDKIFQKKFPI